MSPRRSLPAGGAGPADPATATPSAERSAASPAAPPQAQRGQPAPPRIYARNELPEEIRRQLPTLSIGGSIYSQDRANRFLIINGQVFYEGAEPTPGLVIEQIGLKSAVLRFKNYRYSIGY
ncbi:MAG: general secretion pathway protein GspB [Methylibium sp.]|uniref:general secretion pathway protein GspB n=1 Tax=Methylibium sp. TaxID=2067992 RepID=UPI001837E486|nr:general secretion pathway protein GspB [Methylibium sp.]MBA3596270.1 general secretion pathway protein GspB [Methylibium sp.]